jgi:hypothetical protein
MYDVIMSSVTHVVACDGQKAKLIAILDKLALLHNTKKTKKVKNPKKRDRMSWMSTHRLVSCLPHVIQLTHVVACDGQQANLIANLEQIALLHIPTLRQTDDREERMDAMS